MSNLGSFRPPDQSRSLIGWKRSLRRLNEQFAVIQCAILSVAFAKPRCQIQGAFVAPIGHANITKTPAIEFIANDCFPFPYGS
jgi:hypothetical protein